MSAWPVYSKEQDLVNDIVDLINMSGGLAVRINSGAIVIRDGDVGNKPRVFRGAPVGTSDIIVLWHGKFAAIECKLPGNKMTEAQDNFRWCVQDRGGIHILAYSLEDVINGLGMGID